MKHKSFSLPSWLLPLLLMLLGSTLRLACLGSVPGGIHQDESFVAWNAFALLHEGMDSAGHVCPVYMADWGDGHSALYVWMLIPCSCQLQTKKKLIFLYPQISLPIIPAIAVY